MPREAQRHAVSNGSTTAATSLEDGNLERQIHHSSGELHEVYDRYITVCRQVMQRQDSIDYIYKPWLFFIWTCPVFVQKVQELFREKPPPFHMQVAIQSNHVRLMWWRCLRPNRSIGHYRLRQSWLMCAVPHSSDQNNGFEHGKDVQWSKAPPIELSVPYLLPLNLRKTSRAPIYTWQKQATHHSSETCLFTLDLPIVDLMVPVQYRCINPSEITRGHPLAIWDVIGKPHVYPWTHVSMLLPFDKQMEFPS